MKQIKLPKTFLLLTFLSYLSVQNVFAQAPTIASFAPASGTIGTTVTITGTNFNATLANNIVFFGATRATVSAATANQLSVTVPAGATHDYISVLNTATALMAYTTTKFVPTFTGSGNISANDYGAPINFPINQGIDACVAISDIDGDGKPDLIVPGLNLLSVLRNTSTVGSVSYAPKVDFPALINGRIASVADMDGDGRPDVVLSTADYINGYVTFYSVYRNTSTVGNISFENDGDYMLNYSRQSHVINDMNGDGKPDLITLGAGELTVFMNNSTLGAISFDEEVSTTPTNGYAYQLNVGDLDGDGKPDVAVSNNLSASVSVFKNSSEEEEISFAPAVTFSAATFLGEISIGDLDGDGKLDLAVISYQFNISLLRNIGTPGTIAFEQNQNIFTGENSGQIPIGDLNGDGKLDMAIDGQGYDKLFLYQNTSQPGSITYADNVEIDIANFNDMKVADIDGDGRPEIIVLWAGTNDNVAILKNNAEALNVLDIGDNSSFIIYPNPANSSITIKNSKNYIITNVDIIDVSGRVVQSIDSDFENEVTIDVSHLSAGNYFLKLQSEKGIAIKKFIKN